jgi:riboflavin synthase
MALAMNSPVEPPGSEPTKEIMFTGIIEEVGRVDTLSRSGTSAVLGVIATKVLESMQLGDSIAVNGVCLTVRRQSSGNFQVELSQETLNRSSLGKLKGGSLVNLERPLLPTSRLGGHFVQGHVDAVGKVLAIRTDGDFAVWKFLLPNSIERYVVEKGSIAVDGISLTVASLTSKAFEVALIPHTLENTNLRTRQIGDEVNLECDVLAKYVESMLKERKIRPAKSQLTEEYLKERGFY